MEKFGRICVVVGLPVILIVTNLLVCFFDNTMLSSEFGMIDDVYSAVDRKVIGVLVGVSVGESVGVLAGEFVVVVMVRVFDWLVEVVLSIMLAVIVVVAMTCCASFSAMN